MAAGHVDATASRKVELAVGELDSLSVQPCVAVQYLTQLLQGRFSPASLAELIESEPALAAATLALAQQTSTVPVGQRHAVRLVLDRLDADAVRDALLAAKVTAAFEIEFAQDQPPAPARTDLDRHCIATALCAQRLAETAAPDVDPQLAYTAGLLHDLGKLVLQDIMPKSLAAITQQAQATNASLYTVEQNHLGTNHALLGKRLAQRWRLPEEIRHAMWLHHVDAAALAGRFPGARIALLVWAADHLARAAGIGHSGSFDAPALPERIARFTGVPAARQEEIQSELPEEVRRRAELLGLDMPNPTARYCDLIQTIAAQLSSQHTEQANYCRELQTHSGHLTFAQEFQASIDAGVDAIDVAAEFARRWQRYFQTGAVCLYLPTQEAVDVVVVEALGHSRKLVLETPADEPLIPPPIAARFALVPAGNYIDWLVEQLETDFDLGRTRLVPLLARGNAAAVLAFEVNLPGDIDFFADRFETAASMAGVVLDLALARGRAERLAEQLAPVTPLTEAPTAAPAPAPSPTADPVEALAEMAAGIAHELNNPLSVIAGRAQLLAESEPDEQKKDTLEQIREKTGEASGIVDDLMSFAKPSAPRTKKTPIRQIIDEAIELARQKTYVEHVNAQVEAAEDLPEVSVDSGQVVSAVANVIANAIEAYADAMGPVKITAEPTAAGVAVRIADLGCGMDADTARKATHPFYSAKPAGRKRGMGLAYADRLLELNQAALKIESRLEEGTTITITLPAA
jgi:putative nucleotidyltransferase with HDIG domain